MKGVLLVYSGTGNTRLACQYIAARLAAQAGLKDEYDWFVGALDERRGKPAEDMLGVISNLKYEGRDLAIEEQLSYCTQFLVAGNETTTATLAEGIRQLCLSLFGRMERQQPYRVDLVRFVVHSQSNFAVKCRRNFGASVIRSPRIFCRRCHNASIASMT